MLAFGHTIMVFATPGTVRKGGCEALRGDEPCAKDIQRDWPLARRMCASHAVRFLDPVFRGCGCGPMTCIACTRYRAAGVRVAVVGERENGPARAFTDLEMLRFIGLSMPAEPGETAADSARRAVVRFQKSRRAFSWGASRKRLICLGLRWDIVLNLLGSHPRKGEWDADVARQTANILAPLLVLGYDRLVLLGKKVEAAFAGLAPPGYPVTLIGHPSGSRYKWNKPEFTDAARRVVDGIYAGSLEDGGV